jgi:N-formylglutamate deformylase
MKRKLILHIPHSSYHIPLTDGYAVSEECIQEEILKLTDWYTDELFQSSDDFSVVAAFSRVFCDVERFVDDSQEVMAQYGMGVCYEKGDDGKVIRKVDDQLRETILEHYYWKHHNRLTEVVSQQLKEYGKALILDCHSFPSKPFVRDLDQSDNRPDFNIGTDSFHTPTELVEMTEEFFQSRGFSLGIDAPYAGSIVPLKFYGKDKNVMSIMLEVNRKLYLNEPSNQQSDNFQDTKQVVQEYTQTLRTFFNK